MADAIAVAGLVGVDELQGLDEHAAGAAAGVEDPPFVRGKMIEPELLKADLPTGVIVGSAVIEKVTELPAANCGLPVRYQWHRADVERERLRKPKFHPQPVWFKPF